MNKSIAFDEVDLSSYEVIDDEIGLYWEDDEIEEKFDPDYPPERYKHLKIIQRNVIHAR